MSAEEQHAELLTALNGLDADTNLVFESLSSPRRRCTLACLHEHVTPMPLDQLAGKIAAWELHAPIEDIDENNIKTIHVSLYHVHVPKLADAGLVEYDPEHKTVAETAAGKEISKIGVLPSL